MDSRKGYVVKISVKEATIDSAIGDGVEVYFKVRCTAGRSNRSEPGKVKRSSFSVTKIKWTDEVKLVVPEDCNFDTTKIMIRLYKTERGLKPQCIAETHGFLISEGDQTRRTVDGNGELSISTSIISGTVRQKKRLSIHESTYSAVLDPSQIQTILHSLIKIVSVFCWVDIVNTAVAMSIVALLSYCPSSTADCCIILALVSNLVFMACGFGSRPSLRKLQKSHCGNGLVSRLIYLLEVSHSRHCKEVEFHLIMLLGNCFLGLTNFFSGRSEHTVVGLTVIFSMLGVTTFLNMPLSCVILLSFFVVSPLAFEWALLKERLPFLPSWLDLTPEILQGPIKFYNGQELSELTSPPSLMSPPQSERKSVAETKNSDWRSPSTKFLTPESEVRKSSHFTLPTSVPSLPNLLSKDSKDLRDDLNNSSPSDDSVRNCQASDCREDNASDRPIYCAVVCPIEKKFSEAVFKEVRELQEKKLQGQRNGKAPKHDILSAACTLLLTLLNQSISAYRCFLISDELKKRLQDHGSFNLTADAAHITAAFLPLNKERDLSFPMRSQMGKCTRGYTFEKELEHAIEGCKLLYRCTHPRTETSLLRERLISLSYVASEFLSTRVTVCCRMGDNLVFVTRLSADPEKASSSSKLSFPDDYVPYFREDVVPKPLLRAFLRAAVSCGGKGKLEPTTKCSDFMKMQIANAKFRYHKTTEMMNFRDTCGTLPETSAPDESPGARRKDSHKKIPLPKKAKRDSRFSFFKN
eukprot:TRINITY_DN18634_c0_g1_i3.p1 TRINITY_DN18634_c0_g1~~TRINITY_DN18634_c0_g1_i3.p1  ORF type:complete len:750 (+),score=113.18 TRINITY_DN18634_c0_g1_i3:1752-4001(+)